MNHGILYFVRRLAGLNHINNRFDALESRLGSLVHNLETHPLNGSSSNRAMQRYAGVDIPLYITSEGKLAFQIKTGCYTAKVMVISAPKAGTHFLSAVLEKLGWTATKVNLSENSFTDGRFHPHREIQLPLEDVIPLIQGGQFAVGHLPCNNWNISLLKDFRCLFIYREIRSSLISFMRFFPRMPRMDYHRQNAEWTKIENDKERMVQFLELEVDWLMNWLRNMSLWVDKANVCQIRFEDFAGDYGEAKRDDIVKQAMKYLGANISDEAVKKAIMKTEGKSTLTWSGGRSSLEKYWSKQAERIFIKNGGVELNKSLGYDE